MRPLIIVSTKYSRFPKHTRNLTFTAQTPDT